ncbi:hypothetical protein BDV25DRAFT_33852 [Aspergillus avenaceus]|uniref:Uncharacterized protein n=1 Tax=Aspergillus avenaceus TaxID=36643 RepID=A0A5N6TM08_ASPAV|nr:hypothetical protein BDV25DRAFT_33852 [Aspergillus avenaceus]
MPTTNTSSPVKRPGLGRRAVSSHAVVTRSTSTHNELANSNTSNQQKPFYRQHRAHIVGGHRNHHRNPSFGKNLNKLQRHTSQQQVTDPPARFHQRKKSAPATPAAVTPAASPRGQQHVRWDGVLDETHQSATSMKKNNSSPALRRNSHSVIGKIGKKALVTDRPHTSSGKKKTVGFELADSDNDDAEWEDTTQSPESTRRSSVAQSKDSVENPAVLVDPLTFVKRSYPQFPRSTSLPESSLNNFGHNHLPDGDNGDEEDDDDGGDNQGKRPDTEDREEDTRPADHTDIASRLLSPSVSAKAPPAMSSISATAKPATVDSLSRNASLTNLASGHESLRRPLSSSQSASANTPGNMTQATSSSIEGGVSRFIKTGAQATSRTDSDPNTPSSFLPHYHPQTPPSPGRTGSRKMRASPPSRPPGAEPHSRTQQKLWLQRTAALNTSPPDGHGVSTTASPSAMDPAFITSAHSRPGVSFDAGRGLVNGASRIGSAHDNETKHVRKAYEKTALELTVVRRFQSPTGDSFRRLSSMVNGTKPPVGHQRHSSLGKPIKSAPTLALRQNGKQQTPSQNSASPEPKQLISRKRSDLKLSASQTCLQEPGDLANETDPARPKSQHPSNRILSSSDEPVHPSPAGEDYLEEPSFVANEADMMIRRIWESREVAIMG